MSRKVKSIPQYNQTEKHMKKDNSAERLLKETTPLLNSKVGE
jgi:hypothetical protein